MPQRQQRRTARDAPSSCSPGKMQPPRGRLQHLAPPWRKQPLAGPSVARRVSKPQSLPPSLRPLLAREREGAFFVATQAERNGQRQRLAHRPVQRVGISSQQLVFQEGLRGKAGKGPSAQPKGTPEGAAAGAPESHGGGGCCRCCQGPWGGGATSWAMGLL